METTLIEKVEKPVNDTVAQANAIVVVDTETRLAAAEFLKVIKGMQYLIPLTRLSPRRMRRGKRPAISGRSIWILLKRRKPRSRIRPSLTIPRLSARRGKNRPGLKRRRVPKRNASARNWKSAPGKRKPRAKPRRRKNSGKRPKRYTLKPRPYRHRL